MPDYDKRSYWFALTAMTISVLALLVSIYEARIMRSQQVLQQSSEKASVWPYLKVNSRISTTAEEFKIKVSLINKGVGPALVKKTDISIGGELQEDYNKTFAFLFENFQAQLLGLSMDPSFQGVLSPQEEVELFVLNIDPQAQNGYDFLPRVDVCYCSIFDDCWKIKESGDPDDLKAVCPN